jgi:hypothetical protein
MKLKKVWHVKSMNKLMKMFLLKKTFKNVFSYSRFLYCFSLQGTFSTLNCRHKITPRLNHKRSDYFWRDIMGSGNNPWFACKLGGLEDNLGMIYSGISITWLT